MSPMAVPTSQSPADAPRPKVAIADKNPVVRAGLKDFIARDGRFDVVGAFPSGAAFLEFAESQPVDIAILGWSLPDMTGADVLGR